jgi:hypothetical protein
MDVDKDGYAIINHNINHESKGKDVMLIMKVCLEKHVYNIEKKKGRILIVDFHSKITKIARHFNI